MVQTKFFQIGFDSLVWYTYDWNLRDWWGNGIARSHELLFQSSGIE